VVCSGIACGTACLGLRVRGGRSVWEILGSCCGTTRLVVLVAVVCQWFSTRTRTSAGVVALVELLWCHPLELPARYCGSVLPAWSAGPARGAVNLAGAQRDRGVQGLGGLGVGGMSQAAAVGPVTSFQTVNRRVISVR
jgi:hypothetical protein